MDHSASLKPRIGVSACLTGLAVRYDGQSRYHPLVSEQLAGQFQLVPFCPEVAIGLGVPRPPIQIVEIAGRRRVRGVIDPAQDVTDALRSLVDHLPADLAGFILKARSPSCGLGSAPVMRDGVQIDTDDGAFAAALRQRFPAMPLIDEEQVQQMEHCRAFIAAVHAWQAARR